MQGFLEKTRVEREALRLVNRTFGKPELCGMTLSAIQSWLAADSHARGVLEKPLLHLSALIGSLWNKSGDRQDITHSVPDSDVEVAMKLLSAAVVEHTGPVVRDIARPGR